MNFSDPRMRSETYVMHYNPEEKEEHEQLLIREQKSWRQWATILEMVALTGLSVVVNFVRGTKNFKSIMGIEQCSPAGWGVFAFFVLVNIFVSIKNFRRLKHEQYLKNKYNTGLCKSDIILEGNTTYKLLAGALLGSWIGVTFGLGGGIVFNPVQIAMGVHPVVASSTSMFMIMLATLASTVMYIYQGQFEYMWTGWFMIWCGVGVVIGMLWINEAIKRSGRSSIVVLMLSGVIALATVLGVTGNVNDLRQSADAGVDIWAWQKIC